MHTVSVSYLPQSVFATGDNSPEIICIAQGAKLAPSDRPRQQTIWEGLVHFK